MPALGAHPVRADHGAAIAAMYQRGRLERVMAAPVTAHAFGCSSFGYGHELPANGL